MRTIEHGCLRSFPAVRNSRRKELEKLIFHCREVSRNMFGCFSFFFLWFNKPTILLSIDKLRYTNLCFTRAFAIHILCAYRFSLDFKQIESSLSMQNLSSLIKLRLLASRRQNFYPVREMCIRDAVMQV